MNYCVTSVGASNFYDDYESLGSLEDLATPTTVKLMQLACGTAAPMKKKASTTTATSTTTPTKPVIRQDDIDSDYYGNRSDGDDDDAYFRATMPTNDVVLAIQQQQTASSLFDAEYESIGSYEEEARAPLAVAPLATTMMMGSKTLIPTSEIFSNPAHFDDMKQLAICFTKKCRDKKKAKKQAQADAEARAEAEAEAALIQSSILTLASSTASKVIKGAAAGSVIGPEGTVAGGGAALAKAGHDHYKKAHHKNKGVAAAHTLQSTTTESSSSSSSITPTLQQQNAARVFGALQGFTAFDRPASTSPTKSTTPMTATTPLVRSFNERTNQTALAKLVPLKRKKMSTPAPIGDSVDMTIAMPIAPSLSQMVSLKAELHQPTPLKTTATPIESKPLAKKTTTFSSSPSGGGGGSRPQSKLIPLAKKTSTFSSPSSSLMAGGVGDGKPLSKLIPLAKKPITLSSTAATPQKGSLSKLIPMQKQSLSSGGATTATRPLVALSNPTSSSTLYTKKTKSYLSVDSEPLRPLVPLAVSPIGQSFRERLGVDFFANLSSPFSATNLSAGATTAVTTEVNPFGYKLACGSDWRQCPRKNVIREFPYLAQLWDEYKVGPHVTDRVTALVLVPSAADVRRAREMASRVANPAGWIRAYLALHIVPDTRFEELQVDVLDAGDGATRTLLSQHRMKNGQMQSIQFRNDGGDLVIVDDEGRAIHVEPQELRQVLRIQGDIYPNVTGAMDLQAGVAATDDLVAFLSRQLATGDDISLDGLTQRNKLDTFISMNGALNIITAMSSLVDGELMHLGLFGRRRVRRRTAAVAYVAGKNSGQNQQPQQQQGPGDQQQQNALINVLYKTNADYLPMKKKEVTKQATALWEDMKTRVKCDEECLTTLVILLDDLSHAVYTTKVKNGDYDGHSAMDASKSLTDNGYAVFLHETGRGGGDVY